MALGLSQDWRYESRREMGFSKELDKNVSNGILGLNGYKNDPDSC